MKKMKHLLALLLVAVMVIANVQPLTVYAATGSGTGFAGGSGTESDPYLIATKEQLNNVRNNLGAHYKMVANIVFTEADFAEGGDYYNDGNGWEPIATRSGQYIDSFGGTFDGNNHFIDGLHILGDSAGLGGIGLFGSVHGEISNLEMRATVISVNMSRVAAIGCITGSASQATISNCRAQGEIIVETAPAYEMTQVGGICGFQSWSTITNCENMTNITCDGAFDRVGGICGQDQEGSINKSINRGQLQGTYNVGGIVGDTGQSIISSCANFGSVQSTGFSAIRGDGSWADYGGEAGGIVAHSNTKDQIYNCFNIAKVTAGEKAGGILGYAYDTSIKNSYNAGSISADFQGGIIGWHRSASLENCYFIDTISNAIGEGSSRTGSTKCADSQLKQQATFNGFNFEDVWEFAEGNYYKYPTLRGVDCFVVSETALFNAGSGTKTSPYCIASATQLHNVRNYLGAHYKLVKDIVFTEADFAEGGKFYFSGSGWQPIGGTYSYAFTGVFDGNGYSIYNLQINATSASYAYVGLFTMNYGTIKNLGMEDFQIALTITGSGNGNVGGIAGENCGTITNCFSSGKAVAFAPDGYGYAGGIAGYNYEGIITECYNTGLLIGSYGAGGIAGHNSAVISNCFNVGFICSENATGNCFAGGIAGTNHEQIINCYNTGYVTSNIREGGITGSYIDWSSETATISNCYYIDNVDTGTGYDDDGTTKCTADHFKRQDTFGGFDFESVWTMAGSDDYLYPELVNTPTKLSKKMLGVTLSSLPCKTQYYAGLESFDATGGKLALVYSDGTYTEVDLTEDMVTGFDNTKVGTQTLSVAYAGEVATFDVEILALVYDFTLTTDEQITLECTANKEFTWVLSDETVAIITKISSSTISWGSTIKMTSAATIVPLKPGYVVLRGVDTEGNIITKSLLLIEEGEHQLQLTEVITPATCTDNGVGIYSCKFCEYEEQNTIYAPVHVEVVDAYEAPTCEETGLTEGKHCSRCNEVLIEQEEIPATGHSWVETTTENNNLHYECSVCHDTYTKINIKNADIKIDAASFQYNTSLPRLPVLYAGEELVWNEDYELIYTIGGQTYLPSQYIYSMGTCTITVRGMNQFFGELSIEVDVTPFDISKAKIAIPLGGGAYTFILDSFEYDGTEKIQQGVILTYQGMNINPAHYDIAYKNNIEVGTATIIFTAKGERFTGTVEGTFQITPRPYTPGDIDGVEGVTDADAEYLLMYTFFPEDYPVNQSCDFNGDGFVNDADAEHLLMYTFFPEDYPLH